MITKKLSFSFKPLGGLILNLLLFTGISFSQPTADLVLLNGKIYTADSEDHFAQAVAVKDSVIIKVGSNTLITNYIGASTTVYNLNGKLVTPGLIDSHTHMITAGETKVLALDFLPPKVKTISDIQQLIANEVQKKAAGEWIYGHGFFNLSDGRIPNRYDLDTVAPDNPVFIVHISGHMGVANSMALQIAGIDSSTQNPPGGVVEKDSLTGEPTGVLLNHYAMILVKEHIPPYTTEQYREALDPVLEFYHDNGITSIQDVNVGVLSKLMAYKEADSLGTLTVRTQIFLTAETAKTVYSALAFFAKDSVRYETPMLKFAGFKLLVDGYAPMSYCYEPTNGFTWNMATWDADTLNKVVSLIHDADYQLSIHCMGDRAIDMALDALEAALQKNPRENHRHRLEHCFIPTQSALQRIKNLGLVVSFQPGALYPSGESYRYIFGESRINRMMPIKTMYDMGIPLAFGSDYPTTPELMPQLALQEAIVRKTAKGNEIGPAERIDRVTALKIHTLGSAYAAFEEDKKGSLEEGKLADMAVWSGDYFTVPISQIKELTFDAVILGGSVYKHSVTGIDVSPSQTVPNDFQLLQNYPNPFNPTTTIQFQLPKTDRVTLKIYNLRGQEVQTLLDEVKQPGSYKIKWDGKNHYGRNVSTGLYVLRMEAGEFVLSKKIVLLK
ncbi:MAG: amidohydrolase family protein [bacterium]